MQSRGGNLMSHSDVIYLRTTKRTLGTVHSGIHLVNKLQDRVAHA